MKKNLVCLILISLFLFVGCDTLLTQFVNDVLEDNETQKYNYDGTVEFSVWGFSEDSVVLSWGTDKENVRYNVYVKNKNGEEKCVESNYGKINFFVSSDNKSSYAIGILLNDKEVYRTDFIYPKLEEKAGFPVSGEISSEGKLGVEFSYPSNVDFFSLEITKEDSSVIIPTNKFAAAEMSSYLLPLRYDENSHNNKFVIVFTIGDKETGEEYKSAPYYFDYEAHTEAKTNGSVNFYPTL